MLRWLLPIVMLLPCPALADNTPDQTIERTQQLIEEVRTASFPELKDVIIRVELLRSDSDYFRTRFAIPQFLSGRMIYLLRIRPEVFALAAPEAGIRAIIAHELSHILWFRRRNRLQLLGLMRLASAGFTARFERWTDLQAIARGYGDGLKQYRMWLYQHVPPQKLKEKQRNYFSPAEIEAIQARTRNHPELFAAWFRKVPLSPGQILSQPPSENVHGTNQQ
ncbi:MAG TPA: hypothetical protein VNQ79_10595 [Blastocatellia bacterium]|nr:hypothetical protein [Blastocatellia bacterium]